MLVYVRAWWRLLRAFGFCPRVIGEWNLRRTKQRINGAPICRSWVLGSEKCSAQVLLRLYPSRLIADVTSSMLKATDSFPNASDPASSTAQFGYSPHVVEEVMRARAHAHL